MTVSIGIVGTTAIDPWLIDAMLNQHQNAVHVVGFWSPPGVANGGGENRLAGLQQKHSLDELLAASDGVYIAAPVEQRLGFVQRAIARDKPVFCEPPLCDDLADTAHLVRNAGNARIAVNYRAPCLPAVALLHTWLNLGTVGAPDRLVISPDRVPWAKATSSGGASQDAETRGGDEDLLTHYMFISRRLFGPMSLRDADLAFPFGLPPWLVPFRAGSVPAILVTRDPEEPANPEVAWTVLGVGGTRIRGWSLLEHTRPDGTWESDTPQPSFDLPRAEVAQRQVKELAALSCGEPHHLATGYEAYEVEAFLDLLSNDRSAKRVRFSNIRPFRPRFSRMSLASWKIS